MKYYNPNLSDSIVDLDEMNKTNLALPNGSPSKEQMLKNSGYIPYVESSNNPVSSSTGVRDVVTQNKNTATNLAGQLSDIGNLYTNELMGGATTNTPEMQKAMADLEAIRQRQNSGQLLPWEIEQINIAGQNAGAPYEELISSAQREKMMGLPKATIAAGERGGFMSTQMAGAAALTPVNEGNWMGGGGELQNIKNIYDTNIFNLKAKQQSAIAAARASAESAIRTGLASDLKDAMEMVQLARENNAEAIRLASEKVDIITKYETAQQARVDTSLNRLSSIASVGGDIPDELKSSIDSIYGAGYADKYLETSKSVAEAQSEADKAKAAADVIDLLGKIPAGKTVKIGDSEYTGWMEDKNNQIFKEVDANGNVSFVTVDKSTGQVVGTATGGKISTPQKSSSTSNNTNTGNWSTLASQLGLSSITAANRVKLQNAGVVDSTGALISGATAQDALSALGTSEQYKATVEKMKSAVGGRPDDEYKLIMEDVDTWKGEGLSDAEIIKNISTIYNVKPSNAQNIYNVLK